MSRNWFLALTIIGLFFQLVVRVSPIPEIWHPTIDAIQPFLNAVTGVLGFKAYSWNHDGTPAETTEPPQK